MVWTQTYLLGLLVLEGLGPGAVSTTSAWQFLGKTHTQVAQRSNTSIHSNSAWWPAHSPRVSWDPHPCMITPSSTQFLCWPAGIVPYWWPELEEDSSCATLLGAADYVGYQAWIFSSAEGRQLVQLRRVWWCEYSHVFNGSWFLIRNLWLDGGIPER